jgi:hypothetical protein
MMMISKEQSDYIDHLRGLEQFRYRTKEHRQGILRWVMGSEWMRKGSIDNKTLQAMYGELERRIENE